MFFTVRVYANPKHCYHIEYELISTDTTVYNGNVDSTAELLDALICFRENNRHNDWSKNDKKITIIQGIVEKDSTISNVRILKPSKVKQLDEEALRLIKSAKYRPATLKRKYVRSKFIIAVSFPAE
jgi:TonB family protein